VKKDNRVLGRQGARDLTPGETDHVKGGMHTLTKCTFTFNPITGQPDGDVGDC
jgi:hypothetical protein